MLCRMQRRRSVGRPIRLEAPAPTGRSTLLARVAQILLGLDFA
jgi:hypothetical protein